MGKFCHFPMDLRMAQPPTTMEVLLELVENRDIAAPLLEDLAQSLAQTSPGAPIIPELNLAGAWYRIGVTSAI